MKLDLKNNVCVCCVFTFCLPLLEIQARTCRACRKAGTIVKKKKIENYLWEERRVGWQLHFNI